MSHIILSFIKDHIFLNVLLAASWWNVWCWSSHHTHLSQPPVSSHTFLSIQEGEIAFLRWYGIPVSCSQKGQGRHFHSVYCKLKRRCLPLHGFIFELGSLNTFTTHPFWVHFLYPCPAASPLCHNNYMWINQRWLFLHYGLKMWTYHGIRVVHAMKLSLHPKMICQNL